MNRNRKRSSKYPKKEEEKSINWNFIYKYQKILQLLCEAMDSPGGGLFRFPTHNWNCIRFIRRDRIKSEGIVFWDLSGMSSLQISL
ncbi:hypothetical protein CEXT_782921 [Caerostris extrusa]|uniref:Ycf15 n=1 Tax=Caerostris extrusa TaxID=172846 RepID=A0AAV4W5U6_CAEEX|nr:hypothetical protein CEXT_782921 [Caerostris extrusa]